MDKIKIVIVEDDLDWLKLIINYLNKEKEFVIAGTAMTKNEAIELARLVDPDFVIMDIHLSGNKNDGIEAAAEIGGISKAKIIILSALKDPETIIDSFSVGAVKFLTKDKFHNLIEDIKEMMNGLTPLEILLKDYKRLKRNEYLTVLTAQELKTFNLLEQGFTQKEIASKLVKSTDTVKNQITSIFKKLDVRNVQEALRKVNLKSK